MINLTKQIIKKFTIFTISTKTYYFKEWTMYYFTLFYITNNIKKIYYFLLFIYVPTLYTKT